MPHYSLSDISKAVRENNIIYHGRKVQRDISNLGYELADVKNCLLALTNNDFQKSIMIIMASFMMLTFLIMKIQK